ncbi:MAG: hypothetical protein ACRD2N_16325 [Vicinamibacterales bacterium]
MTLATALAASFSAIFSSALLLEGFTVFSLQCGVTNVVSQTFASWNQLDRWLRQVEALRRAA